jgi:amidase
MTPLEVGSDLVSSIRLPASFCGVYGLKTTEHRVPLTGFLRQPHDLPRTVRIIGCLGPMARDLDDLELALRVIAGPDGRDGDVPPVPLPPLGDVPLAGLRLAVAPTLPGVTVAASLRGAVERLAARASDAGARVGARLPDVDWEAMRAQFGELLGAILCDGERPVGSYFRALHLRDRVVAAAHDFFEEFDALVLPPAVTLAFPHCAPGTALDVDGVPVPYEALTAPGTLANYAGLPALAAPAGLEDGLPTGVQLVGPRWSEVRLLGIARRLEQAGILPGFRPPPGFGRMGDES